HAPATQVHADKDGAMEASGGGPEVDGQGGPAAIAAVDERTDHPPCDRCQGYRTRRVYLATTLPPAWSDREVIDLYRRRWEIETCFGDIKTRMKMNVLKCRSVEGIMKELTVYLLVYNLVRLMMLRRAGAAGV